MMNLLKQACQDHYKTVKKELIDSLEKLKSTCTDTTFNHINNFLKVTKDELCNTLETRSNRKRIPNGRISSLKALRFQNSDITDSNATATNNTSPAHDISVTPTPHVNHNTSTHTRRHRRRRRRNGVTAEYPATMKQCLKNGGYRAKWLSGYVAMLLRSYMAT